MQSIPQDRSIPTAGLDRIGYLFGQKIAKSFSPLLHDTIYKALGLKWAQLRLDSSDINHFLELTNDEKFYGASVTMPNKVAIMKHLDEVTEECQQVGACNTVYIRYRNGRRLLCGTNTDTVGIREAFYQNVSNPDSTFHDRPALVIGGGGAARSAVYSLRKWMRVKTIYLVNRDKSEIDSIIQDSQERGYGEDLVHVSTIEQARSIETPGAIVACLPDIPPQTPAEWLCRNIIEEILNGEKKGVMLEMCYNPNPYTALGAIAEEKRWQVILGTEAMIFQGLEQDRYWTGIEPKNLPISEARSVIASRLSSRAKL